MKKAIILFVITIPLIISGCGLQSVRETTTDPKKSIEMDYQMDTPEKRKYWNELKENNDRAIITIDDKKK